jgi:hypothetical protein
LPARFFPFDHDAATLRRPLTPFFTCFFVSHPRVELDDVRLTGHVRDRLNEVRTHCRQVGIDTKDWHGFSVPAQRFRENRMKLAVAGSPALSCRQRSTGKSSPSRPPVGNLRPVERKVRNSTIGTFELQKHLICFVAAMVLVVIASPEASAKRCLLAYVIMDLGSVCVDVDSIRKDSIGLTHFDVYSPPRIRNGAATYAIDCAQDLTAPKITAKVNPKGLERGVGSTAGWESVELSPNTEHSSQPGLVKLACASTH